MSYICNIEYNSDEGLLQHSVSHRTFDSMKSFIGISTFSEVFFSLTRIHAVITLAKTMQYTRNHTNTRDFE